MGIDLIMPMFSHGQLYTMLSRIRHRAHARLLVLEQVPTTTNVTYMELLA